MIAACARSAGTPAQVSPNPAVKRTVTNPFDGTGGSQPPAPTSAGRWLSGTSRHAPASIAATCPASSVTSTASTEATGASGSGWRDGSRHSSSRSRNGRRSSTLPVRASIVAMAARRNPASAASSAASVAISNPVASRRYPRSAATGSAPASGAASSTSIILEPPVPCVSSERRRQRRGARLRACHSACGQCCAATASTPARPPLRPWISRRRGT